MSYILQHKTSKEIFPIVFPDEQSIKDYCDLPATSLNLADYNMVLTFSFGALLALIQGINNVDEKELEEIINKTADVLVNNYHVDF